jgi:hypothetical protein
LRWALDEIRPSMFVNGPGPDYLHWDGEWRMRLVDNLEVLVRQLWAVGVTEIFIDGSFLQQIRGGSLRLLSNGESLCEGSRDRGKAHRDAKLLEFGVDLPRSPGILGGEPTNEFPHFRGDARSAGIRAASVPGPIRNDELPASIGQRTLRREVAALRAAVHRDHAQTRMSSARDMDRRLVQASLLRDVSCATGPGA